MSDEPYIVAGSPVPMPAGWLAQFDRNNKRYFFVNTNVNPPETTWTDPRGVELYAPETQTESVEDLMAQVKATKAEADALNAARAPKVFVPQPVPQAPKPVQVPYQAGATGVAPTEVPLPAGWLKVLDQASGHFYFVDQNQNPPKVTWDDPRTAEIERAPAKPKAPTAAAAAPAPATFATVPYTAPGPAPTAGYAAPAAAPPAAAAPIAAAPAPAAADAPAAGYPAYLVGAPATQ